MLQHQSGISFALCGLLLAGCSSCMVPDSAPESVAGCIITLDDRHSQISECPVGSGEWSGWKDFNYGSRFDFSFDENNRHKTILSPTETTCMTYKKTGACSGEIRYESAECAHTCYLNFTTPTTGTATKEGYSAGTDFKQRNIQFSIKK